MRNIRILQLLPHVICVLSLLILFSYLYSRKHTTLHPDAPTRWPGAHNDARPVALPFPEQEDSHPVLALIGHAERHFEQVLAKETLTLTAAARRYRERRGRQPPPGFDKWWKYAKQNNAIIIEDFWDQIYHDLNPLWALDQEDMLRDVRAQTDQMKIRKGNVTRETDHFWMPIWQDLIQSVAADLPDMDLAMNTMDEPRMWVPVEKMDGYTEMERSGRRILEGEDLTDHFSPFVERNESEAVPEFPWDTSAPIWPRVTVPCPPDSPARTYPAQTSYSQPPNMTLAHIGPHTYKGYVSNYTLSMSICHQPDLQGLHGFFIESISISTTDKLFPMFSGSKLAEGSEILVPPTMYYKGDERFTSKDNAAVPWDKKTSTLVWRGLASGGRNKAENWKGFHRHRLVSMLNGTQALLMPTSSAYIDIANLPLESYSLSAFSPPTPLERAGAMGRWLNSFTDASFNDLSCFPKQEPFFRGCSYTDYLFTPKESISLLGQYTHKYLPDVDGNSFSGRYRDFLNSSSVPLKATLFKEWHDSRLVAWKHFVPVDSRFMDLYGIMEFFVGSGTENAFDRRMARGSETRIEGARDHLARRIGADGREWAQKVLREEDMRVYMYRLLLEYARVMDEKREFLGWVDHGTRDEGDNHA
ncbi:capsule associated protein [Diplocarpon rosae]|nr:capsule associated protein [Diplocarpon rosae]